MKTTPTSSVVVTIALGKVWRAFSASSPRYAGASNPVKASTPNTAAITTPLNPVGLALGLKTCGCQSPPGAPLMRIVSASASRTPSSKVSSARSDRTESRMPRTATPQIRTSPISIISHHGMFGPPCARMIPFSVAPNKIRSSPTKTR